jgi:hypothetical protein
MPRLSDFDTEDVGYENFHQLGRAKYKHSECGIWLRAKLVGTEDTVYYESDEARTTSLDTEVEYLEVGTIIEGSCAEFGPRRAHNGEELQAIIEDFEELVEESDMPGDVEVYAYDRDSEGNASQSNMVFSAKLPKHGHWWHCLTTGSASKVRAFLYAQLRNLPKGITVDISHEDIYYIEDAKGTWGELRITP